MLLFGLSAALANPVFVSEPVVTVQGTADYGYGILAQDPAGSDLTITASVLPDWMSLSHERAWATTTLVGSQGIRGYADGTAETARFKNMYGITIGLDGDLYVADTHNHAIRCVDAVTGAVSTVAGNGELGFADATGAEARFWYPQGIATHPDGTLLVADAFNHVIRGVDPETGDVWTVAGQPGQAGWDDGPNGRLDGPKGVAVSAGGDIYIADSGNHAIRTLDGSSLETIAGSRAGFSGLRDSIGQSARFNSPRGLSMGPDGHLYIADKDNHRVRRMETDTLAVSSVVGLPEHDELWHPFDVAVDAGGNVFIADSSNHLIRRYNAVTQQVETLAGDGSAGFSDGLQAHAQLYFPRSVVLGADGQIYVADRSNAAVRVLVPTAAQLIGHATVQDAGVHAVELTAVSSAGTHTQAFEVTVGLLNQRPDIWGTPPTSVAEGELFTFTPDAADDDGDPLTYTIAMLPHWATFDPQTGTVSGTPGYTDARRYVHVAITADDGQQTDNSENTLPPFMIQVTDTNRAPQLMGTPVTQVDEQAEWLFAPVGSDVDTDNALTYAVSNAPHWTSFDPENGEMWGTPALGDAGLYEDIVVSVMDSSGADNGTTSLPAFAVVVTALNQPPTATTAVVSVAVGEGETVLWTVPEDLFNDPNDDALDYSLSELPAWVSFDGTTLTAAPAAGDAGTVDATVTATDPEGEVASVTVRIQVSDVIAPVLTLDGPDTADGRFEMRITTTEQVADLRADGISITNGVPSALLLADDGQYTVTVTPDGVGDLTVSMAAGVAHDDAGNPNEAVDAIEIAWVGDPVLPESSGCNIGRLPVLSWGFVALSAGFVRRRRKRSAA